MHTTLEIYDHLKPKLGEQETRELLEWIESEKTHLTTKEDLDLATTSLRKDMDTKIAEAKTEIITSILKWMVALWITQMFAILALFFKK